jgi:hypothetical protein
MAYLYSHYNLRPSLFGVRYACVYVLCTEFAPFHFYTI